ncbi:MAG: hypothetical protein IJS39_14620 [Synergistaceae bacterium]|nr:hypothetical protein [Synergistaceae bacterium]
MRDFPDDISSDPYSDEALDSGIPLTTREKMYIMDKYPHYAEFMRGLRKLKERWLTSLRP